MLFGEAPDVVDHQQRSLDRLRARHSAGHENREERGVETAFPHARKVDVAAVAATAAFMSVGHHEIPAFAAEHLRRVDVRVDDDRGLMHARGARLRRFCRGFLRCLSAECRAGKSSENNRQSEGFHDFSTNPFFPT